MKISRVMKSFGDLILNMWPYILTVWWWPLPLTLYYCKALIFHMTLSPQGYRFCTFSLDFISVIINFFYYNPYMTNCQRWIYLCVFIVSRIYKNINSSRIKGDLQYIYSMVTFTCDLICGLFCDLNLYPYVLTLFYLTLTQDYIMAVSNVCLLCQLMAFERDVMSTIANFSIECRTSYRTFW